MPQIRTNAYEGLFLISQSVATDLNGVAGFIRQAIEKNGGTVLAMRKWDERRLAFEIAKQKRGYYLLVYFQAPAPSLGAIERAFNLSEQLLRQLVIKVEHMNVEEMKALDDSRGLETEARLRATQPAPVAVAATPEPDAGADEEVGEDA